MVCAIGLTESAKGQLQAQLAELGTNLIVAQAGGTFGSQNPTFPENAVARVESVSTIQAAAATANLSGVVSVPVAGAKDYYEAFPVPVRAAGVGLPAVLQVPVTSGRWLDLADLQLHTAAAVLGEGIAKQYGYLPGEARTIRLNNANFAVVGVLGAVALDPELDNAVFVTEWAAKHILGTNGEPNQLYIRAAPGTTQATANAIPTAISLGGSESGLDPDPERRAAGGGPGQQDPAAGGTPRRFAGARRGWRRHRQRDVHLGDPTVIGDRHPPRRRAQPLEDRRPVPARVPLRGPARRAHRRRTRCRRSSTASRPSRDGSS